jgi:hypothetical protein
MKPIRITYDRKGNVLSIRFSEKKEACCRESGVGEKKSSIHLPQMARSSALRF